MQLTNIRTTIQNLTQLIQLDESFIATKNYMGLAYFWNSEYKHTLRDCTIKNRIKVHDAWLDNGLKLDEASDLHYFILVKITKNDSLIRKKYGKN